MKSVSSIFRDNTVALEAFKADQADWIGENSAKQWATAYDFPAVADKRVVKEEFPINDVGPDAGYAFNLRREQFKDAGCGAPSTTPMISRK